MSEPSNTGAPPALPSVERIQQELATAKSVDDFFGKAGILAPLFAGNSPNGKRRRSLQRAAGPVPLAVPRDCNSEYQPALLEQYQTRTTELETKILALYAKGLSTRDIAETLEELYGVQVSPATVSTGTEKVWALVEAWQSRPLASVYAIVYLDAIHLKLRRDGRVQNTAVYIVLGVDCNGQQDVLAH